MPEHLKQLFRLAIDSSHYYRQHWYWGGEAQLPHQRQARADLDPRRGMEDGRGRGARPSGTRSPAQSPRNAKVVQILKDYNADMEKAGPPYRYG